MDQNQQYPFPGNWTRLQKMVKEADMAGERQRIEPILWEWYEQLSGDVYLFMEIFQCLMERPDEPETLERLEELVTTQMETSERPETCGLQIAQYYIMRDQPFEAAHWIEKYLSVQDGDNVNTQAYQVLQVLKLTEFPAAIAKLKRTLHQGSTAEQIEMLAHVHFNIDDVLDNVLKAYLLADRPKVIKVMVLERAIAELETIEWTDRGERYVYDRTEASTFAREWGFTYGDLQKRFYGDEIATQLSTNYCYVHYPFVPHLADELEPAIVEAKRAMLNAMEANGLAGEILEADASFTRSLLD
ncbi:hypothetical protein [Exiguobacterium sp. s150]|uniref:hypothetical protein n=1 Tax=Exiguobacterium sp. s150 TaxID=2751221 RepID=UPI001BE8F193|nr:hypothetical protein [Exiguobacterium sp. s150]